MTLQRILGLLAASLLALLPLAASAAPLALDVQGMIGRTNDADHTVYHLSEADLLKLPVHTITTSTTWTPRCTFAGPLLGDVLKLVDARADSVELRTIDDYSYTVSAREAEHYGAILAYSKDGVRLTVSNFGPLFLVYPRDAYPSELSGSVAEAKFVWQIKALVVK
ncbi:oxidoreductase molybdopterin binding protein [Caballeronia udeis]|uniref:Oxidoreductase molybdopterin binding protein n=1 Tax=Caballeronia udeis TaxID=1232866 RepID=A0A158FC46_9BURK|nr:oxidoreductase [Caballeronia udeis]SAL17414.1 oxidoreductase molybdopterin binding protein [Caballeronia udeis]